MQQGDLLVYVLLQPTCLTWWYLMRLDYTQVDQLCVVVMMHVGTFRFELLTPAGWLLSKNISLGVLPNSLKLLNFLHPFWCIMYTL